MSTHTNRYLIDERPLTVQPTLIKVYGIEQALILQQLHWLLGQPRTGIEHDGRKWVWGTYEEWCEDYFSFWEPRTLRYHLDKLKKRGVVITRQLKKQDWDRTNYYTIDYDKHDSSICQHLATSSRQPLDISERQPIAASNGQPLDASYIRTEKTTEISTEKTTGGEIPVGSTGNPNASPAIAHPPPSLIDRAIELADKESFDPPSSKPSSKPTSKPKPPTSPRCDGRKFRGGYIPAGAGTTPVEVYYESFSISEAKLSAPNEDDLTRECTDLDRLRSVLTAYRRSNYRKGNVQLILDWYRDGVPAFGGAPAKKGQVNATSRQSATQAGDYDWYSQFGNTPAKT